MIVSFMVLNQFSIFYSVMKKKHTVYDIQTVTLSLYFILLKLLFLNYSIFLNFTYKFFFRRSKPNDNSIVLSCRDLNPEES